MLLKYCSSAARSVPVRYNLIEQSGIREKESKPSLLIFGIAKEAKDFPDKIARKRIFHPKDGVKKRRISVKVMKTNKEKEIGSPYYMRMILIATIEVIRPSLSPK